MALSSLCYFYLESQAVHLFHLPAPCLTTKVYKVYNCSYKEDYDEMEIIGIYKKNSIGQKGENLASLAQLDLGEYILEIQKQSLLYNAQLIDFGDISDVKNEANSDKGQQEEGKKEPSFHLSDSIKAKQCRKNGCKNEGQFKFDFCDECYQKLKEKVGPEFSDYYYYEEYGKNIIMIHNKIIKILPKKMKITQKKKMKTKKNKTLEYIEEENE